MKPLQIVLAALGGAFVGAAAGLLFAPDKGENTRADIAKFLNDKGIRLKKSKVEQLADAIAEDLESK
ncbi:MAG: YtxH domain-containing protein [Paramuribaculum sp.]|nr:YtxH domain-containing protein [Paramuribaculum sp.]